MAAFACLAWSLGQAFGVVVGSTDAVWPLAAGSLAWAVLLLVGVVALRPVTEADAPAVRVVAAEILLLASTAGFLIWSVGLEPAVHRGGVAWPEQLALGLITLGGAVAAAALVLLAVTNRSPALVLLATGSVVILVVDVIAASDWAEHGSLPFGVAMGWAAGFVLLAIAARLRFAPVPLDRHHPALVRVVLVMGIAAACMAVAVWRHGMDDQEIDAASVWLGLLSALALVGVQVAQWWQSSHLGDEAAASLARAEQSRRELRELVDHLAEAVVVLDDGGRIVEVNERVERMSGRSRAALLGRHYRELVPSSEIRRLERLVAEHGREHPPGRPPILELPLPDGTVAAFEAEVRSIDGPLGEAIISLRDVTERVRTERELARAQRRFRLAFDGAPTGMCLLGVGDDRCVEVNGALAEMLARPVEDLRGLAFADLVHPDDQWLPLTPTGLRRRLVRGDGGEVWAAVSAAELADASPDAGTIVHVVDVTEEVRTGERLAWSATHDEVTGLANRTHFLDALRQELKDPDRPAIAVLFLDLDRFKVVNDSLGHASGDDLLRVMAGRLRDVARPSDLVARFGGDEFTMLVRESDATTGSSVAEEVRQALAVPADLGESLVDLTTSIGVAVALPEVRIEAEELVRDADAAMYRAKERGRDRVETFTPETRAASVQALLGRNELRQAIERDEIVPYFQPIVELASGRLSGYEVMARWRHPDRGLLLPDSFLPVAEERGLIGMLGARVLRSALGQLARWQAAGDVIGPLSIAVNVSARQLVDTTFVDVVASALTECGVAADSLWLELTETALMADVRSATTSLRELRNLGLHLAVDDFGTGYSSLTYLKRFPVEAIKVDRAFVAGLGIDSDDSAIVEAVVRLAGSLGLRVVAEGVETPLQLARLRDLGCGFAQGYLFGRPRPADLLEPFHQQV